MLFASKYAFEFTTTSRRDDLISLCYLLVYFIDESMLSFIDGVVGMSKKEKFKYIRNCKLAMTCQELCGTASENPETHKLLAFVEEVMGLAYAEEPNYNKLRFLLTKALLDAGSVPNKQYDWLPRDYYKGISSPYR